MYRNWNYFFKIERRAVESSYQPNVKMQQPRPLDRTGFVKGFRFVSRRSTEGTVAAVVVPKFYSFYPNERRIIRETGFDFSNRFCTNKKTLIR